MNEDQLKRAMKKRLSGKKCKGKCAIHGESCNVVLKYKDKKIQATVDALNAIAGAPKHTDESDHYCEVCACAIRDNRPTDSYQRNEKGFIALVKAGKNRLETKDGVVIDTTFEEE